ncbi:MAG: HD domain-containing protein [Solirubrobacterales bacterium]
MITLADIKQNETISRFMALSNVFLGAIGAIQHNLAHADLVSVRSRALLTALGYPERDAELAAIAGYLHDIGNVVNRYGHGMAGALIVFDILLEMGMNYDEIAVIMGAIGSHEEQAGGSPVNRIAAAVILADKSDVHQTRVRKTDAATFTTRDRVNYAAQASELSVDRDRMAINLKLAIDNELCSVMDYFEIFLTKMVMCKRAAEMLSCRFELTINEAKLL